MHSLVAFAVMIPLILVVYIPIIPLYAEMIQNTGNTAYQPNIFENYSATAIVGYYLLIFIASFIMQAVSMSVYGHFFRFLKKDDLNTDEDIGGYFTLLKDSFGKLLLLSLATIGIGLVAMLFFYLPIFYAIIPLHFIFPFFIFNSNLNVTETVKAAFKFGTKNWGVLFGIGFVCSFLSSLGMIACYVGLFATMFFPYIATYVTYRDTIGFEDADDEIDTIGALQEEL